MTPIPRILFVDDVEFNRKVFLKVIQKEKQFQVNTASNGIEALGFLKQSPADIVITDIKMPEMDGLSLLNEIRDLYPDIFVIVVTGHASIDNAVRAMKSGAYDYLLKPFDFTLIKIILEKIVEHSNVLKKTAVDLDIARGTLYSKLKKYCIKKDDFISLLNFDHPHRIGAEI